MSDMARIRGLIREIYGEEKADFIVSEIGKLIRQYSLPDQGKGMESLFDEKDVVLITYGDSLYRDGEKPLNTLHRFALTHLKDIVSTIHILPCFPWTSDDGFSVTDYHRIDPPLGTWEDVRELAADFKLMLDFVLNHISAQSPWMKNYLAGTQGFEDLAIEVDPQADLSQVTRPRALPLLTEFRKDNGQDVHVWTTFSADQVDLNFADPQVFLKMAEVLMRYAKEGASILRLDAIAYLWKEIGTSCIHLPKTHLMVKLFRLMFDAIRKNSILLTETNVPHPENISYFGNGEDEAHMVYNFTLPPLLLYSFIFQDAGKLKEWARTLSTPSPRTTFFNFTASHDGIGVRPLEGVVPGPQLNRIIETVEAAGGRVSYKQNSDGSQSPYELNLTYVDAMKWQQDSPGEEDPLQDRRFLASQAIQMALPGVPAVYIHSLLGSHNWQEGVEQTGRARTINREKLAIDSILSQLETPETFRSLIFRGYTHMLRIRRSQPAFHPNAAFEIPEGHPGIFSIIRRTKGQTIYAITNITAQTILIDAQQDRLPKKAVDLLAGKPFDGGPLSLEPYDVVWLSEQ